jgi:hypothetical protein
MLGESNREPEPWEGRVELGQRIIAVAVPSFPIVRLTFADGYKASFDFSERLPRLPSGASGSGGGSLEWINDKGDEIDFCADSLRMEAEGIWDPITREWKV